MKTKSTFQQIVEDLTPEQREELKNATDADWSKAIKEVINDPSFWRGMLIAFVDGVSQGLADAIDDNRK
jgi:hypothetical protein